MVFLVNEERVIAEVMELCRLHIAGLLQVAPGDVEVKVSLEKGKIVPQFDVKTETGGAWEADFIQKGIAEVWLETGRPALVERLRDLGKVRHGFFEEAEKGRQAQAQA